MKISKKIIAIIISTIILLMINVNQSTASTKGVITDITVRLREKASTTSKILTFVTQDDEVEVIEKDGDWYKIKFNNYTGYIFGEYIKIEDESKLEDSSEEENQNNNNQEQSEPSNQYVTSNDKQEINEETNSEEEHVDDENLIKEYKLSKDKKILILPNINSSVIYTIKEDVTVEIIERLNKWSYINVQGIRGWIRNALLEDVYNSKTEEKRNNSEKNEKQEEQETVGYIKYSTVNLRKEPSTTSKVLAKLKLNTEVKIKKSYDDSWYEVEVDKELGYVSKELISDKKQKEETNDTEVTSRGDTVRVEEITQEKIEEKDESKKNNSEEVKETFSSNTKQEDSNKVTGEDIVEYAKTFFGCKYKYGGTSPSGFDCSGLTYYVYKHFGYKINRSSAAQAKNGVYVEKSDLQKGDLVLFRKLGTTGNIIGHVGIYIGNDKFIEASDESTGVIISSLSKKNYADRYITARRILDEN